jgi:hypothetical protein
MNIMETSDLEPSLSLQQAYTSLYPEGSIAQSVTG